MLNLLKLLKTNSNVLNLEQDLKNNKDCSVFGFNFGEKTWLVNSLKKTVLYITTFFILKTVFITYSMTERILKKLKDISQQLQLQENL